MSRRSGTITLTAMLVIGTSTFCGCAARRPHLGQSDHQPTNAIFNPHCIILDETSLTRSDWPSTSIGPIDGVHVEYTLRYRDHHGRSRHGYDYTYRSFVEVRHGRSQRGWRR